MFRKFLSNCGGERGKFGVIFPGLGKIVETCVKTGDTNNYNRSENRVADLSPIEACSEAIRHKWYQAGSKFWSNQGLVWIQGPKSTTRSENDQNHGMQKIVGELYFPETTLGTINLCLFMVMFDLVIG